MDGGSMLIKQVFNNNVVLVLDSVDNREYILTGKGIGFGMKKDMYVDENKIERKFEPTDEGVKKRVMALSKEVDDSVFELVNEAQKLIEKNLNRNIHEYIYLAIVDHIYFSLKRFKEGIYVRNTLLHEIKRLYKKEFVVAMQVVEMINEKYGVNLGEDEAGFITMHIVNSSYDSDTSSADDILVLSIVKDILQIIRLFFRIDFDEDSLHYDRLITHLRFFAKRVISGQPVNDDNDDLLEYVRDKNLMANKCAKKIGEYMEKNYNYRISSSEELYLTLHIDRVTK